MKRLVTILLLLLTAASSLAAERFPHGRWSVGLDAVGGIINGGDDRSDLNVDDHGSGAALRLGFLLGPTLQIMLHSTVTEHQTNLDDTALRYEGATFDIVYLFRPGHTFRPYLSGGGGGYMVTSQKDALTFESEGGAAVFGAGFHMNLNRHLGLHAQGRFVAINWNMNRATLQMDGGGTTVIETPIEKSGTMTTLSAGGTFRF